MNYKIGHDDEISSFQTNEKGTEAAAATVVGVMVGSSRFPPPPRPTIIINRPFLFGIARNDDIIFIGQYV